MANGMVGGIGAGLFILAFVWVICIFTCLAFSRAQGGIAYAGIGTILLAIIITLTLWFFPRGGSTEGDYVIYDSKFVLRTAIISVCGIFLAAGLVMYVFMHLFENHQARPLKMR